MKYPSIDPKVISILSYFTFVGWLVAVVLNRPRTEQASFHIRQSLGIMLLWFASRIVDVVPFTGHIASQAIAMTALVFWIIGLISAINGEMKEVPLLGGTFQEMFDRL